MTKCRRHRPEAAPLNSTAPTAIVVLGMHRSGTSAVMRVLNLLGVQLGRNLLPAQSDNVTGFWEQADVVAVHDQLLRDLGSAWTDPRPLFANWWKQPVAAKHRQALLEILRREFAQSPLWGFKDPRASRLLPLWNDLLDDIGTKPVFVILVRHPLEVAASLGHREIFGPSHALALWAEHLLAAEEGTRGRTRIFVAYDDFLHNWREPTQRIAREAKVSWPRTADDAQRDIEAFLQPSLRHQRHEAGAANVPPWIEALYARVQDFARRGESDAGLREVDGIRGKYAEAIRVVGELIGEQESQVRDLKHQLAVQAQQHLEGQRRLAESQREIDGHKARLAEREATLTNLSSSVATLSELVATANGERDRVLGSRSWRATRPLRAVGQLVRRMSNGRPAR